MAHHRQVLYLSCFCLLLGSVLAGYFCGAAIMLRRFPVG